MKIINDQLNQIQIILKFRLMQTQLTWNVVVRQSIMAHYILDQVMLKLGSFTILWASILQLILWMQQIRIWWATMTSSNQVLRCKRKTRRPRKQGKWIWILVQSNSKGLFTGIIFAYIKPGTIELRILDDCARPISNLLLSRRLLVTLKQMACLALLQEMKKIMNRLFHSFIFRARFRSHKLALTSSILKILISSRELTLDTSIMIRLMEEETGYFGTIILESIIGLSSWVISAMVR